MQKTEKEKVVADLVERLRTTESLIVADYRGLTNAELVGLRAKLRSSGAQLKVVKNTLTRRAAEEAGAEALLALLEGPTAIAFVAVGRRRRRRREGAVRHREGDEGPRPPRRDPLRPLDHRSRRRGARQASRRPRWSRASSSGVIVAPLTQLAALRRTRRSATSSG